MPPEHLLAASVLSADFTRLGAELEATEAGGADWIHIDVMDGQFVPNLSMGPAVVAACRRASRLPLDVHLMVREPAHLIDPFADAGADGLTVHVEACTHLHRVLETIRARGLQAGVSLNPATPPEMVREVLPIVDLVLVMCVDPGYSGQTFQSGVLGKIRTIRDWVDQAGWAARIQVDGGINADTAALAAQAGASVFVAASAVYGHPGGIGAGLQALRSALALAPA